MHTHRQTRRAVRLPRLPRLPNAKKTTGDPQISGGTGRSDLYPRVRAVFLAVAWWPKKEAEGDEDGFQGSLWVFFFPL